MNDDSSQLDAGFFPHFAAHSFLDALGRLAESGERGVPVRRPALLASEQDVAAGRIDDCHDDGWVGAREGQVGNALARCTGWPFGRVRDGCLGGCGGCSGGQIGEIGGRAGTLETTVHGECGLAALCAEGVTCVPVKELTCFGVDGG